MSSANGNLKVLESPVGETVSTSNGVIEYTTKYTAIRVWVRPMPMRAFVGLQKGAVAKYPDPKPPMIPVDDDPSAMQYAIKDIKEVEDLNDPEYLEALEQAREARNWYIKRAQFRHYTELPDYTEDALVERFADDIDFHRALGAGLPDEDYDIALFYCAINTVDEKEIFKYLLDAIPVTQEETEDQLRVFRPKV